KYEYRAEGSMGHYRAGMGIDLAPDLSFGLALGYLYGKEEVRLSDGGEYANLRIYNGMNLEPSLMFKFSPRLRMGFSAVIWENIHNLEDVYEEKGLGNDEENYDVRFPMQVKTGLAYQGESYLLAADLRINGWSQFEYGAAGSSLMEKAGYKDELILSLGGEKFIAPLGMVARGGYAMNALTETDLVPTYILLRFCAGAGFMVCGYLILVVDVTYTNSCTS